MEEKIVILKEDGTEDKAAMRKQKIKNVAQNVMDKAGKAAKATWGFIVENKENVTFVLGLAATGAAALNKLKPTRVEEHRDYVDNSVYDYVSHQRFYLKRPMRNSETIEYLRRLETGEPAYRILSDMRLLRR